MTNQVIPAQAVEAAAEALLVRSLDISGEGSLRKDALAALEAAAPHMLAGAWDEGWYAADLDSATNPYRPTP